ncbi:MAG: Asp-tRNA(Asn)/Glu-tRNA(Gln) amidotransferase subunit GatB, partial [Candidatus Nealsonbacteria bacterium]|nr:Asp-tRNA(Asn)/Glu-tRNA(Gln) amidotransferase subunit GatB [Candidatus Nealsonbacteria bacterium]
MKYKTTVGLEIHSELKTNSKMFCSCKNDPDEKRANFNICPTCTGQPGTLPVANEEAIRKVLKTGMALNCKISETSKFDRKNYFYPDLPKGYQISQYDKPFCKEGFLDIGGKKVRITRIHLEEDTGRLLHEEGEKSSLVDFNRAGIPLMELVTEPDIESGIEARKFAEELQLILRYLGVSDADMEKGQMRVEVNISVSKDKKLGTKVEIKNLNSFKVVEKSIDFEIKRQIEVLESGEKVVQETRGWHDKKEITFSQREKEEAHDYRYFPEPDLPTLHFEKEFLDKIKSEIPELPSQKRARFAYEYGLDGKATEIFIQNRDLSEYFEKVVSEFRTWIKDVENRENIDEEVELIKLNKIASNYIISDVLGLMAGKQFVEKEFKITPENFAEFITMIYENEISSKIAKIVLPEMFKAGEDPSHIVEDKGLEQISDEGKLEQVIKMVIDN